MPAAGDHLKPRVRDQAAQEFTIDQRHNIIRVAHHDECFGAEQRQPRCACPAHHRDKLIQIAHLRWRADAVNMAHRPCISAAVKRLEVFEHEIGINITTRIGHFAERGNLARDHQHSRRRRYQNEAIDPRPTLQSILLRHRAAPANPNNVNLIVAIFIKQQISNPRDHPRTIGDRWFRRSADTGHVEGNKVALRHLLCERRDQFKVRANAIEKQDRQMIILATLPPRDANGAAINLFHRNDWRHARLPFD